MAIETKTEHYYYFYGRWVSGYGPSMDPHRHGHPDEPCMTLTFQREVSDWELVEKVSNGNLPQNPDAL